MYFPYVVGNPWIRRTDHGYWRFSAALGRAPLTSELFEGQLCTYLYTYSVVYSF